MCVSPGDIWNCVTCGVITVYLIALVLVIMSGVHDRIIVEWCTHKKG
jgi:hypothetical protein